MSALITHLREIACSGHPIGDEAADEIEALRSRVSELEEIARLAAASVRNQAWAGVCDEDILLEQALAKANFIRSCPKP